MPIYEYECKKCGHTLEALQKFSDKPLRECPECGKHQLKRLVSAPMFRLAGSGWYETDFKSDKERKRNILEKGDKEPAPAPAADSATPKTEPPKAEPAKAPREERSAPRKTRTMGSKSVKAAGTGSAARKPKAAAKPPAKRARKR
jgi:putative FmdB family regulatory protein